MNERIFELAKQADLIQWDTLPSGARTPDHESVVKAKKFAELIVRDVLSQVEELQRLDGVFKNKVGIDFEIDIAKEVLKNFGVES